MCIFAQSPLVAAFSMHDAHHNETSSMHYYFHEVGQSHEHNEDNTEQFEVSYSKQALEHSNTHHDGGIVGIFSFLTSDLANVLPDASFDIVVTRLPSPFIKYTTPPPKI